MATLHRLLWGSGSGRLREWEIRPWETPAIGLPSRVGGFLLKEALEQEPPGKWAPSKGPLVWRIEDTEDVLAKGRRLQFGKETVPCCSTEETAEEQRAGVQVRRCIKWEVPPHGAYFLPLLVWEQDAALGKWPYVLYTDILLLLTAADGDERSLDRLLERGPGKIPFPERWDWRSRIHFPVDVWEIIEAVIRGWGGWRDEDGALRIRDQLMAALDTWVPRNLSTAEFRSIRVDIRLDARGDGEIPRSVRVSGQCDGELPDKLLLEEKKLVDEIRVRIGQVSAWPPPEDVRGRFAEIQDKPGDAIMQQVAAAFQAPHYGAEDQGPDLVILPEAGVPQPEVRTLRELARVTGRAALAGLYWRVLSPVYPGPRSAGGVKRWFVNEAELIVPVGFKDRGPTSVRWYRVRKPIPAHVEEGLACALGGKTCVPSGSERGWCMLPGHRWYRFVHPEWGDFTVAICADLLDPGPWRSLRGEILHLFMVAYNKDVDLFDSLTWVRAYENYVNLVSVNHGRWGGSFLWTPKHGHGRELARLRGSDLLVLADVKLPVRELLGQQRFGVQGAISDSANDWQGGKKRQRAYKAPPPGYVRKALKEG